MPGVDITWEPNAPDAVLISDDFGRGALALTAHPKDPDRRTVVLRFDLVMYSAMTPPNDEALNHHPLYDCGLKELLWLGVVRESRLAARLKPMWHPVAERRLQPMHFIAPLKECVVEVVAAKVDVFRLDGDTRQACLSAINPGQPLQA
jgi:hypothetical protein